MANCLFIKTKTYLYQRNKISLEIIRFFQYLRREVRSFLERLKCKIKIEKRTVFFTGQITQNDVTIGLKGVATYFAPVSELRMPLKAQSLNIQE